MTLSSHPLFRTLCCLVLCTLAVSPAVALAQTTYTIHNTTSDSVSVMPFGDFKPGGWNLCDHCPATVHDVAAGTTLQYTLSADWRSTYIRVDCFGGPFDLSTRWCASSATSYCSVFHGTELWVVSDGDGCKFSNTAPPNSSSGGSTSSSSSEPALSPGDLRFYKDRARNGTADWSDNTGSLMGSGWNAFTHVLGGSDGVIYAVKSNGDLMFYKDLARDGTANWAGGGGQKMGSGWDIFSRVFGDDAHIYAIK